MHNSSKERYHAVKATMSNNKKVIYKSRVRKIQKKMFKNSISLLIHTINFKIHFKVDL